VAGTGKSVVRIQASGNASESVGMALGARRTACRRAPQSAHIHGQQSAQLPMQKMPIDVDQFWQGEEHRADTRFLFLADCLHTDLINHHD